MVSEGDIAALGAALCWTVSAVLYKKALSNVKPTVANIVRCTSTSIILLVSLALSGKFGALMDLSSNAFILACISGLIGLGLGDTLYLASLKLIGVARAVPITCTYPLFSLLWAMLLGGEDITPQIVAGTILIIFGIWLLSQDKQKNSAEMSRRILVKGVALAATTAIIWSISISMVNMAVKETPDFDHALAINIIRVTVIAVFLLASALVVDRGLSFLKMQKETFYALSLGGVVALGLGWFFLTYSFAVNIPEARAVPISSTTPLFSTLSGIIFLHEKVTKQNILGSILIVVGIFLVFMD
ncbi:MAG: DMT family transporter [Candidatus Bathycorpusculaceae bacterium]